ncbi:hypothetical protein JTE90_016529 [Oedothorax gibbosus]|uniref:Uncharacterized protein n=1 Tax=Oedothorax gibbosus TaxID=931172 RepID=A0AAV6UUY4_9ARAC|nr:hypothetical protein JTE90_016529 [Oedothorax gibbosus]
MHTSWNIAPKKRPYRNNSSTISAILVKLNMKALIMTKSQTSGIISSFRQKTEKNPLKFKVLSYATSNTSITNHGYHRIF